MITAVLWMLMNKVPCVISAKDFSETELSSIILSANSNETFIRIRHAKEIPMTIIGAIQISQKKFITVDLSE